MVSVGFDAPHEEHLHERVATPVHPQVHFADFAQDVSEVNIVLSDNIGTHRMGLVCLPIFAININQM